MSDILAGRTEINNELKRVIVNAESMLLKVPAENCEDMELAISMLKAALTLFNECLIDNGN
jgi:hypothetical protein